jgi:hypothetical protein
MIYSDQTDKSSLLDPRPGVAVSYWLGELELNGAEDFRSDLEAAYAEVSVESARGGLGGGLYTLFVEICAAVTLPYVVQLILNGIAFDLIKLGTEKLILRPLLTAQRKLKERNRSNRDAGEFAYLRIMFSDSNVIVDADSRVNQSISESIGKVLLLIAQNYEHLSLADGRTPVEIYIPVIEDTGPERRSRFRAVLEVDEDMPVGDTVFFEYWGLSYSNGERRVYDVQRRLLLDELFLYRHEYWQQRGLLFDADAPGQQNK